MMKAERLFQPQCGPIILSQIENEYGLVTKGFSTAAYAYMTSAAKMADELDIGVPWVMCKEDYAPDLVVLNGYRNFLYDSLYHFKWYDNAVVMVCLLPALIVKLGTRRIEILVV